MTLKMDGNTKSVDVVIIYPCRVTPFDKVAAEEMPYGKKVRVAKEDADDLIGMKRAVRDEDYTEKKYPCPPLKLRNKAEAAETAGGEKPLDRMNKAELVEAARVAGLTVPEGATNKEIIELLS